MHTQNDEYINPLASYAYTGKVKDGGTLKAQFRWSGLSFVYHVVGFCPTVALTSDECIEAKKMFEQRGDKENADTFQWGLNVLESLTPEPSN